MILVNFRKIRLIFFDNGTELWKVSVDLYLQCRKKLSVHVSFG
jgi:hypothetical protein